MKPILQLNLKKYKSNYIYIKYIYKIFNIRNIYYEIYFITLILFLYKMLYIIMYCFRIFHFDKFIKFNFQCINYNT